MKKGICALLSLILFLSCFSVVIEYSVDQAQQNAEKRNIDSFWAQVSELDGDINCRLVVKSDSDISYLNAVDFASGSNGVRILQFKNESDLIKAREYYESLDCVEFARQDTVMQVDSAQSPFDEDTKCYAAANSNLDDVLKLIYRYFIDPPEIKVGVIDTGVENNDVFSGRIVGGEDMLPNDDNHGSYVAGTILYNTPDNVKVYSYKAGSGNNISTSSACAAIYKAVSDGCKIINMSFGSEDFDFSLYAAVLFARLNDVVLVASAGNDSKNLSVFNQYPAEFSGVWAVGSMAPNKTLDSSSNYGTGIFTYATGNSVRTNYQGKDVYWNGTSAAAPIVCAAVADMLCVDPNLSVSEIEDAISETEISPNENNTSRDIIDAYAAAVKVCALELEQASFDYDVTVNEQTGYNDITFSCDSDTRIYYYLSKKGTDICPINISVFSGHHLYKTGEVIHLDDKYILNAVAYSPNKIKSSIRHICAGGSADSDYDYSSVSKSLSFCRSIDDKVITVPSEFNGKAVTKIGSYCFSGNKSAEVIVLPNTVTEISEYAFSDCPNLKKVIAPGVKTCGRYAFLNCGSLLEVIMPQDSNTLTGMFKNCLNLRVAQLADNNYYTSYYNKAFAGCDKMLNYYALNENFSFNIFNDKGISTDALYILTDSDNIVSEPADEVLYLWNDYYINKEVANDSGSFDLFDSTALFDADSNGIVNAKDYAIIKKAACGSG